MVTLQKGLYIREFKIDSDNEKTPFLKNDKLTFREGRFVIRDDGEVRGEIDASFVGCRFKGKGVVNKGGIDFLIENGTVDFLNFGRVAGVKLHGKGDLKMHAIGPFQDVWFKFGFDLNDFEIAEYKLKNIAGDVDFSFKNNSLYLRGLSSTQEKSRLVGNGELSLKEKALLNLNIKAEGLSLEDSYFLAKPVFDPIKDKLRNVKARYSGNLSLKIDFDNDNVESEGNIYTEEVSFYANEYVDVLYAKFIYKNKKLIFDNVEVRKGTGTLEGRFEVNVENDFFKYHAKLSNLKIQDVYLYQLSNLQYKGRIWGESSGEGTPTRYRVEMGLRALQGTIGRERVRDGRLAVQFNQDHFKMEGKFLGDVIKFKSNVNFGDNKGSYFKGEVNAPDIGILVGLISRRGFSNKSILGEVRFLWDVSFNMNPLKVVDVDLDVKKFAFKYDQLALDLVEGKDRIVVKKGVIKKWDVAIMGKNNFLTSVGSGDLSGNFEINQKFKLDASLGMLFNSNIENGYGPIFGIHLISWRGGKFENDIWIESEDVFLKVKDLVDPFSKVKFRVSMLENKIVLENLSAVFGDGTVRGRGNVMLNIPYPIVNIDLKMENSKISFFKKSSVVASADVRLRGKKLPYVVSGKVSILHGNVKDEIKDILGKFSTLKSHNKYIPQRSKNNVSKHLNYDLDVNVFSPIAVSNSLFDVTLEGGSRVSGNLDDPLLDGKFDVVSGGGRIMFKNHNFIIGEGSIVFNDTGENKIPRVKLVGAVDVDDYKIKLNVFGDVESMQVELSSVPVLPQQDILSLLALGVTTNMNRGFEREGPPVHNNAQPGVFGGRTIETARRTDLIFGIEAECSA